MELVFITEGRFIRHPDGKVYSVSGGFNNLLWGRYLRFFEKIKVVGRVLSEDQYDVREANLASGDKVTFVDLPYYIGPVEYIKVRRGIEKKLREVLVPGHAYICRVPGQLGGMAASILRSRGIPYGVEVVGDPWDVFAPAAFKHPLRGVLRYWGYWNLKKVVGHAVAALYVTKEQLQKRYPALNAKWIGNASNVMIKSDMVPLQAHVLDKKEKYELISVGSLAQMYKAPDVVIQALSLLKEKNVNVHVTWLGDGIYKKEMQKYAQSLGMEEQITFVGAVAMEKVVEYLKNSDIFLLVSRTEGLPRALIEAMAEGLPCVATRVGGIPELLDDLFMIPVNDAKALAEKVSYMLQNVDVANRQAALNFQRAKDYYDVVLQERRNEFYRNLVSNSK